MKILIVNETFNEAGGAERYMLDVSEGFRKEGFKVGFLCGTGGSRDPSRHSGKLRARREAHPESGFWTSQNDKQIAFVDSFHPDTLKKELTKLKPDLLYLQNIREPQAIEYFAENYPTYRFIHDHRTYCPGSPKMWFTSNKVCPIRASWKCAYYAYKEKCLSRRPQKVVSEILRVRSEIKANSKLKKIFVAAKHMKEKLVQNGVDSRKIIVNPLFPSENFPHKGKFTMPDPPVVLCVARLFVEKGVKYLIHAVSKIKPPYRVWVSGTGWDEDRLKKLTLDLGLSERVKFLGFVPHQKLPLYFAQCSVVAFTSIWPEPFGLVGMEAMAAGKPVVAFKVGGPTEWLEDGKTGFLVPRANVNQLAEKIDLLLSDEKLRRKMGYRAQKRIKEFFNSQRHINVLIEEFQKSGKIEP